MVSQAKLRFLRASAQKTRLVADQIRGRDVAEALGILKASPKRVARPIEKLPLVRDRQRAAARGAGGRGPPLRGAGLGG